MNNGKNHKLTFTFSNSGTVETNIRHPELMVVPPLKQDKSSLQYSSSRIVQTPDSGFELITEVQLETPDWINNLKAELGIPSNALLRHLNTTGAIFGARWQNYNLRFVGIVLEQSAQTERSWPFWRVSDTDGNDIELIQVWYQRVSCMSSPVYCDVRWRPEQGETIYFPGLENARRGRDITLAWRGRVLLQKINPKGRPESSVSLTREQFFERAPQVCAKLFETFGENPTDVEIAEGLYISRATFYRYMERYNLSLNQIRDMAINLLIEQDSPF